MGVTRRRSKAVPDTIEAFWGDWHTRREASKVSGSRIAELTHSNKTTVLERGRPGSKTKVFIGGDEVRKLLTAINVPEPEQASWLQRYQELHDARERVPADAPSGPSWTLFWLVTAAALIAGAVIAAVLTRWAVSPGVQPATTAAVVEVQNKVALGEDDLREDTTPAYLSTRPVRQCGLPEKNCKIPGTDMASGVLLVATCWTEGDELVNYNLDSPAADNPHRARSARWYQITLPDQRIGLISEVYLVARNRGGHGLPRCAA